MVKNKIGSGAWLKSVGRSKQKVKDLPSKLPPTLTSTSTSALLLPLPSKSSLKSSLKYAEREYSKSSEIKEESRYPQDSEPRKLNKRRTSSAGGRARQQAQTTNQEDSNVEDSAWCVETSEKADAAFATYLGQAQKGKGSCSEEVSHVRTAENTHYSEPRTPHLSQQPISSKSIFSDLPTDLPNNARTPHFPEIQQVSSKSVFSDLTTRTPVLPNHMHKQPISNKPPLTNTKNDDPHNNIDQLMHQDNHNGSTNTPGSLPSHSKDCITSYAGGKYGQMQDNAKTAALKSLSERVRTSHGINIMHSNATTDQSPTLPVDPSHLKSNAIVLLDPKQNGQQYHLDEKNRNLTDKDLLIVRKQQPNGMYNDDESIISSLTEVTYKQNKKERLRLYMNHIKRPAFNNRGTPGCCGTGFDFFGDENDEDIPGIRNIHPAMAHGMDNSLSADATLFLKSVMALVKKEDVPVNYGDFSEEVFVCITRIYMATQIEVQQDILLQQESNFENKKENEKETAVCGLLGLRCSWNDSTLSHDMGVRFVEGDNGQAIIRQVIPQSTAGRSGVKVGDFLSFAVPLNNTFQGYERACDFISRLEMIGMRTSYRELFDMFLSKTSSGWPLAIVFRRQSKGVVQFERISFGLPSLNLEVDFLRASTFLHELITQSREYDYYREADGTFEIIRGNIEYFIPRPKLRDEWPINNIGNTLNEFVKSIGMDGSKRERIPFLPISSEASKEYEIIHPNFRRSALLTGYADNATGIIFSRCSGTFGGSGVVVFRSSEDRSWTTPCAINAHMSVGLQFGSTTIECITFLQSDEMVTDFQKNQVLMIDTQDQGRLDYISFTKLNGSFFCSIDSKCTFEIRDELNASFYSSRVNTDITTVDLFEGGIPHPAESIGMFGALRRLEFPSTMYPHPTPPENLVKYTKNDWHSRESCQPSDPLEPPLDERGSLTLRELLCMLIRNPLIYGEESREFEIFSQKFKQMLFDGVSINRIIKDKSEQTRLGSTPPADEKGLLKLYLLHGQPIWNATLQFITRGAVIVQSERPDSLEASTLDMCNATELNLGSIVCISQSNVSSALAPCLKVPRAKDKKRKRFVSIEVTDGSKIMFLARTGKDASLLSCGLKLLVERFLLQSSSGMHYKI